MKDFSIILTYLISLSMLLNNIQHSANASLHSIFNHYEEIHPQDIKVRVKRNTITNRLVSKHLSFYALGTNFNLKLKPDRAILASDFSAHTVDKTGKFSKLDVDMEEVFSGEDVHKPSVEVNAFHDNGLWQMHIKTPIDVFAVEPLQRFDPRKPGNVSIIYNVKDISQQNTTLPFCRASRELQQGDVYTDRFQRPRQQGKHNKYHNLNSKINPVRTQNAPKKLENESKRLTTKHISKRKTSQDAHSSRREVHQHSHSNATDRDKRWSVLDTCHMMMVVDWRMYQGMGQKKASVVAKWAAHALTLADKLLRESVIIDGTTYGVKLSSLVVYTESTATTGKHFNLKHNDLNDEETLRSMFNFPEFLEYCLTHLITQRNFAFGSLGIATIASEKLDDPNGICSSRETMKNIESRNIGLSSVLDNGGVIMPAKMQTHVMTHEIGHNFGSEHDASPECAPPSSSGGKYLMYPTTGHYQDPNAVKMSPCSVSGVKMALKAKAHICFKSKDNLRSVCGDGELSPAEDCDPGMTFSGGPTTSDPCCDSNCRFKEGATCSPRHHVCCSHSCQAAGKEQECVDEIDNPCAGTSHCDGVDAQRCPGVSPKPHRTPCPDNGTCWHGFCLNFCEKIGQDSNPPRQLVECTCDENPAMMCTYCCQIPHQECKPMGGKRDDGRPCLKGACKGGVCVEIYNRLHVDRISGAESLSCRSWTIYGCLLLLEFFGALCAP